ncbi:hypothetical protein E2C01_063844 [Portunus trituberculatus]|uniref:Uncharacterized protein n=1 Tax=Portunus trituberculatus TaxID=210409 RepID=A0A5B7HM69_PORTR|nr:hypothetical protein [Portunus trituberculatus]
MSEALPCVIVSVKGVRHRVLVDTGCSQSVVHVSCCKAWMKGAIDMVTPLGFMVILGMNAIRALGGVAVDAQNGVRFGVEKSEICATATAVIGVDEPDFSATYDPASNCRTAAWKWSESKEPGVLRSVVEAYSVLPEARDLYEEEL